jgi:hypothetical protein
MPQSARFNKKTSLLSIALSITAAGFFVLTTAHASDGTTPPKYQTSVQQLASIDTHQSGSAAGHSHDTIKVNATDSDELGAFSREDGAMMGAYGDGEYAD